MARLQYIILHEQNTVCQEIRLSCNKAVNQTSDLHTLGDVQIPVHYFIDNKLPETFYFLQIYNFVVNSRYVI